METLQNFGNIPTPPIDEVSTALPMIRNPKAQTAGMTQLHCLGFIIQAICDQALLARVIASQPQPLRSKHFGTPRYVAQQQRKLVFKSFSLLKQYK
jgi:hypothetical protein